MSATREVTSIVPKGAKWIEIGFGDLELSSWTLDYQRLLHADLRILADTTVAHAGADEAARGAHRQGCDAAPRA